MNGAGDGIRGIPTAGGCLETPGIGTNGDITPKGMLPALPGLSREWDFMRIDFYDDLALSS